MTLPLPFVVVIAKVTCLTIAAAAAEVALIVPLIAGAFLPGIHPLRSLDNFPSDCGSAKVAKVVKGSSTAKHR